MMDRLRLKDPDATARAIEVFLFEHVQRGSGVVVGLSGGIDSALTLLLAVRALGPEQVRALLLPDGQVSSEQDMADARAWAQKLGVDAHTIPLGAPLRELQFADGGHIAKDPLAWGNLKARLRMAICYGVANRQRRLVLGSGNRTEWLLGYFTKYGDGGVDLLPIGALYKTQVRQMARHFQLPIAVLEKKPSAGLWEGQTDERELGSDYDTLDRVLYALIDQQHPPLKVARDLGLKEELVLALQRRVEDNQHKRTPVPIASLE